MDLHIFSNIQKHISLSESEKLYLRNALPVKELKRKELVLRQGQICRNLYYVESGSLRAFNLNDDGKESTIMFAIRDWWVTDMNGFVNQKKAQLSIEALEHCRLLELSYDLLERLYTEIPKFERFFRILFQNAYIREQQRAFHNIALSTEQRYQYFIDKYPDIVEKITQKQIATYLGVTPEFLSAVKKK